MSAIPYNTFQKDFSVGRIIGKGCSSEVKEVYNIKQNITYALKIMKCQNSDKMAEALNQMETIVAIDDQAMPKIYYYYIRQIHMSSGFKSKPVKQMGFVMELCQGDLNAQIQEIRLNQRPSYTTQEIVTFIHTFIRLFSKMQKKNYMHRDIKPENILVKKQRQKTVYKLADFGFAIKLNTYSSSTISGTQQYVSPRVLKKFKDTKLIIAGNNFKDDMYSLGITVIQMIFLTVQDVNIKTYSIIQALHGKYVRKILQLMTQYQQDDRPDFLQLQNLIQREQEKCRNQEEKFRSYYKKINRCHNSFQQINIKQKDLNINKNLSHSNIVDKNQLTKSNCNIFHSIQQGNKTKKKLDHSYYQDAQIQTEDKQQSVSKINAANHLKNSLKRIHLDQTIYLQDRQNQHQKQGSINNKKNQTLRVQKIEIKDQQIYCIKLFKNMILFGLSGFIGVAFKENPSKYCKVQIQFPESIFSKRLPFIVTGIKIQQNMIIVFGTSKILLTIIIDKFEKIVQQFLQNNKTSNNLKVESLNKKSFFQYSFDKKSRQISKSANIIKQMPFQAYNCRQTISCVDFVKVKDTLLNSSQCSPYSDQQFFIVMGHYSGQISQYGQINLIKMDDSPITEIKVYQKYLYLSTAKGKLKKYLLQNLRDYDSQAFQNKTQSYNYGYPIVSFSIFKEKEQTKSFKNHSTKKGSPFIKMITFDGYLHILSQKLTLLSWIMIADSGIFAVSQKNCFWQSQCINHQQQDQFIQIQTNIFKTQKKYTYMLNLNGSILDQEGKLVVKSELQKSNCFDLNDQFAVCGSFQGILAIITASVSQIKIKSSLKS